MTIARHSTHRAVLPGIYPSYDVHSHPERRPVTQRLSFSDSSVSVIIPVCNCRQNVRFGNHVVFNTGTLSLKSNFSPFDRNDFLTCEEGDVYDAIPDHENCEQCPGNINLGNLTILSKSTTYQSAQPATSHAPGNTRVYITGIPPSLSYDDVTNLLSKQGNLNTLEYYPAQRRKHSGTAIGTFQRPSDAKRACRKLRGNALARQGFLLIPRDSSGERDGRPGHRH